MKAHSERVPKKNFRVLGHKPLFRWILDSLLDVEAVSKVVINTDAREILAEHGLVDSARVLIRDRKPELCGDMVSMNRVLADDVQSVPADVYLMTHTTNPFLSAPTIRQVLADFTRGVETGSMDSLFTVNRMQTRFYRADGSAVNHDPKNLIRTQDLEPWFEENSCLYAFTRASFEKLNARIGEKPGMFPMRRIEAIDIDTPDDWALAELIARGVV
ncbi:MAG: acylneuraminate cytidylyltransferase family protein [Deltaproteobacteria bacterium]|nr:acylneuraminate cytidylyltransferase family protein [Deltaproteobacteria bacterium]